MTETLAGVSPLHVEPPLELEVPSLSESAVGSRGATGAGDSLDALEAPGLDELSGPSAEELAIARELVRSARSRGVAMTGPAGLLQALTKTVIETALDEEMTEHLGYDKHDPAGRGSGNSRNGTRVKTVLTDNVGPVEIEVPRDRDGTFDPVMVRKRQRRLGGVDTIVLSLVAKGLTTGEVSAHFEEIYGASLSKDTISKITDRVVAEMEAWMARPLEKGRFLTFVANQGVMSCRFHRAISCAGERSPRQSRGRSLSSSATSRIRASSTWSKLVPLGKYCRRRPLVFSLVGRCQGECGSAK